MQTPVTVLEISNGVNFSLSDLLLKENLYKFSIQKTILIFTWVFYFKKSLIMVITDMPTLSR